MRSVPTRWTCRTGILALIVTATAQAQPPSRVQRVPDTPAEPPPASQPEIVPLPGPSNAGPRTAPPEVYTPDALVPRFGFPPPYGLPPYTVPYSPYGYGGYGRSGYYRRSFGGHRHFAPYQAGRQAESWRQDALEARRAVEARRRQRAKTGRDRVIERPGPYPYNPAPIDPSELRHFGPYGGYGYDPYYYGTRHEGYRTAALAAREELTLMAYEDLLTQGLQSFRARQYGSAARAFIAAAQKHHGDAGSRIHAAQALVAVGLYDEALVHVRRAVSLKPLLLYMNIDLRADYGVKGDFDKHVAALADSCKRHSDDLDQWLLLAYVQFFSPHPETCIEAVMKIQRIVPRDRLAERLTRAAKPIIAEQYTKTRR